MTGNKKAAPKSGTAGVILDDIFAYCLRITLLAGFVSRAALLGSLLRTAFAVFAGSFRTAGFAIGMLVAGGALRTRCRAFVMPLAFSGAFIVAAAGLSASGFIRGFLRACFLAGGIFIHLAVFSGHSGAGKNQHQGKQRHQKNSGDLAIVHLKTPCRVGQIKL